MQGAVQSCVTCGVQYAMHQSTWKSFRDASEKHGVQYTGSYSDMEPEFWIFKSVPKLVKVISLNPVNSGDSNGVIHVSIPALGDKNRILPCFCLPALPC